MGFGSWLGSAVQFTRVELWVAVTVHVLQY